MEKIVDGNLTIVVAGPAGFGNNIYVVVDGETGTAAFIDAPDEMEKSVEAAEFAGVEPSAILLTHGHGDHTASIDKLKAKYGCELYGPADEPGVADGQLDHPVGHGGEVKVGSLTFQAIHNPGHTPGSTTYVHGKHAFVGDTLFPGGPGHSRSNALLQQEIESIRTRLLTLPEDVTIWPGHGDKATIAQSKAEYEVFASKEHDPDLHGDVNWLES